MTAVVVAGSNERVSISEHYHLYVGDLDNSIDDVELKDAFAKYGAIS